MVIYDRDILQNTPFEVIIGKYEKLLFKELILAPSVFAGSKLQSGGEPAAWFFL